MSMMSNHINISPVQGSRDAKTSLRAFAWDHPENAYNELPLTGCYLQYTA